MAQISFEPGLGAYQGLAQKWECPFPRFSAYFWSCEGSRAFSKPAPHPGTHQTPVETLSDWPFLGLFSSYGQLLQGSRRDKVTQFASKRASSITPKKSVGETYR